MAGLDYQHNVVLKPLSINHDIDEQYTKATEAKFLKNYRVTFNNNPIGDSGGADVSHGQNAGKGTKLQGNQKVCDVKLPSGKNISIGAEEFDETNEVYIAIWNENKNHTILRINCDHTCQIVYQGACLDFQINPKHRLNNRMKLVVTYDEFKNIKEKYLLTTDGYGEVKWIAVELSIKTNSFATDKFKDYTDECCSLITLNPTPPKCCPKVTELKKIESDCKINFIKDKVIQFAQRFIYLDGRTSVLGIYSKPFILNAGCSDNVDVTRCLGVELCVGSHLVTKIELYARECGGDWYLYDTIEKYKCNVNDENNEALISNIHKRDISIENYNAETKSFIYEYCGDKQCAIADQQDLNRLQNDLPRKSFGIEVAGDALMLANNYRGYANLDCKVTDTVKFNTKLIENNEVCELLPTRKIKIGLVVHNMQNATFIKNQFVYKAGIGGVEPYDTFGNYNFGGFDRLPDPIIRIAIEEFTAEYGQTFYQERDNFIGFLRGTGISAKANQVRWNYASSSATPIGTFNLTSRDDVRDALDFIRDNEGFYIQEFEFEVKAGKYVFQVGGTGKASLDTKTGLEDTSTYVLGTTDMNYNPMGAYTPINYKKELYIDVCEQDYDYKTAQGNGELLLVADNTVARNAITLFRQKPVIVSGYFRGTKPNGAELPIPLQQVTGLNMDYPNYTDHNGFYWGVNQNGANFANPELALNITYLDSACATQIKTTDLYRRDSPDEVQAGYQNFTVDYPFIEVCGSFKTCDGVGVGGVLIVPTWINQPTYTNTDGTYCYCMSYPHSLMPQTFKATATITAKSNCEFQSCNCDCIPSVNVNIPVCPIKTVELEDILASVVKSVRNRLKSCGVYRTGIGYEDCEGRLSFVQPTNTIEIPDLNKIYNGATMEVYASITKDITLPKEAKCLKFYITENTNQKDYLQWSADGFYYLTPDGKYNKSAASGATNIAINIKSLLDYNVSNNLSTNTTYQFVNGDVVRILTNCDGKYLASPIQLRVTGVRDGQFVLVELNSSLQKYIGCCDVLIELIHPNDCASDFFYQEISCCIPIKDGIVSKQDVPLDIFDTYIRTRNIPNYNVPTDSENVGQLYGCTKKGRYFYESSSPSDFFGKNCNFFGRINKVNPQAEEIWYRDEIAKSDELVNEGRLNGLGTFRDNNRKDFKGQNWGGIVAIHGERNMLFCVCENDWFTVSFNQRYTSVTQDGLIQANFEDAINDPQQKVGANYGCMYEDTNSIVFSDGTASWVDRKRGHIILSDYRSALDITEFGLQGYFDEKLKHILHHDKKVGNNYGRVWDIVSVKDYKYNELIFTFRPRLNFSERQVDFVNNEREPYIPINETFTFNIDSKTWVRAVSYTPENYAQFKTSTKGVNLLSFANGIPFSHNDNDNDVFNTFYGVKVEQVIELVAYLQQREGEVHIFQNIAIESDTQSYFIDRIFTDEKNSNSWIPLAYWKRKENVFYAEILRDASSYVDEMNKDKWVSTLIDGKRIFGKFIRFRIISANNTLDKYNEIDHIDVRLINSERSKH